MVARTTFCTMLTAIRISSTRIGTTNEDFMRSTASSSGLLLKSIVVVLWDSIPSRPHSSKISFQTSTVLPPSNGLPLGNLTSQLLVNIYMNEFDKSVKHALKATYYIRYADDFVALSHDRETVETLLPQMHQFLEEKLVLTRHPNKVSIETLSSGVDFLGWVHFPDHRVLRTNTKRRMLRKVKGLRKDDARVVSYRGLLRWGNTKKLEGELEK